MHESTWKWIDTGSGPGAMQRVLIPMKDRAQHVREMATHRQSRCQNGGSTEQTMPPATALEGGA